MHSFEDWMNFYENFIYLPEVCVCLGVVRIGQRRDYVEWRHLYVDHRTWNNNTWIYIEYITVYRMVSTLRWLNSIIIISIIIVIGGQLRYSMILTWLEALIFNGVCLFWVAYIELTPGFYIPGFHFPSSTIQTIMASLGIPETTRKMVNCINSYSIIHRFIYTGRLPSLRQDTDWKVILYLHLKLPYCLSQV